jgi:thiamine-phosphate pyrophosphorylase
LRPTARLIDANANRAREGLRVLEDIARFTLADQHLAGELKDLRHTITRTVAELIPTDLALTERSAETDVGRTINAPEEHARSDLRAVARAAGSRTTEALRVLEEAAKVASHGSVEIERARYRAYDAAAAVARGLVPIAPQWPLCVLITGSLCTAHPWERVAELAIEGGATCVQLREKDLPGAEFVRRARALTRIARPRGAHVIINDRPDIALLAGADGVHLGQRDLCVADARAVGGARLLVGVSCSSPEDAAGAHADGASMIGIGAMFPTTTKAAPDVRGTSLIGACLDRLPDSDGPAGDGHRFPHLAIGGITPGNAREVVEAGARGLAVSSCVCSAGEPGEVCRRLAEVVRAGRGESGTIGHGI